MRLDLKLTELGITNSRSKANEFIKNGFVLVNQKPVKKPSALVSDQDSVELTSSGEKMNRFVSRSAQKLDFALKQFKINAKNKVCLDIGASTGGFTQVLLENGALEVTALDVGSNQLDQSIRENEKVKVVENENIRFYKTENRFELIVSDVSFISLNLVLPKVKELLKENGEAVLLIKPQFELGKTELKKTKNGVIESEEQQIKAVDSVLEFAKTLGFKTLGVKKSPLVGEKGNQEYLLYVIIS